MDQELSYELISKRCLENDKSTWKKLTMGVPQGSILGSLLFTLYVSDLPTVVNHCGINLYANNTEHDVSIGSLSADGFICD